MKVIVNGEPSEITAGGNLSDLIKKLNLSAKRVVVLVNDTLIPAEKRAGYVLNEGDRVEILTFAGGG